MKPNTSGKASKRVLDQMQTILYPDLAKAARRAYRAYLKHNKQ